MVSSGPPCDGIPKDVADEASSRSRPRIAGELAGKLIRHPPMIRRLTASSKNGEMLRQKGPVISRTGTHRSITRTVSCAMGDRGSCGDSPLSEATSRPTKPVSRAKHSMRLVAGVNFRSTRPRSVAEHRQAIYESLSLCYEAYRASTPTSFNSHGSRIIRASSTGYTMRSSMPSTPATGSTADCRWPSLLPRARAVAL
jgi:hypothetical protein